MKLSKNAKIILCLTIWSFLLYLLFFKLNFEKVKYSCAVCRGEITSNNVYLLGRKIIGTESTIKNVDETYKKFINEEHSHIWVRRDNCEIFTILGKKIDLPIWNGLEPSFSSVYVYNTSLKMIKKDLKNGNSADILKRYNEYIEQIRLNSIDLESKLRAKNMKISDLLND